MTASRHSSGSTRKPLKRLNSTFFGTVPPLGHLPGVLTEALEGLSPNPGDTTMEHHPDGTLNPDALASRIRKMAHRCGTYAAARHALKQGYSTAFVTRAILGRV
jgi:hypothetical protein